MSHSPFHHESAQKRLISLRYWLQGAKMYEALRALEFNRALFAGKRKDGVTPEFDHHVCQAQYIRTLLPNLLYPEETLCTVFFHDTFEDKGLSKDEVRKVFVNSQIGDRVVESAWKMTKVWRGEKYDEQTLFDVMAQDPIASLDKGVDRIHNFQSMVGVFSKEKQLQYIEEGQRLFLPMLKKAEQNFPEQEPAYKNIRTCLKSQMHLIAAIHQAGD